MAYTRKGDKGVTSIPGRGKVWKDSTKVEACGSIDELISTIGLARAYIKDPDINRMLMRVQEDLFSISANIVAPQSIQRSQRKIDDLIRRLETEIDKYATDLEPLRVFVVPGSGLSSALLHLARAVTRRVERRTVTLARREKMNDQILAYLNRLSSLFFILARLADKREGQKEDKFES